MDPTPQAVTLREYLTAQIQACETAATRHQAEAATAWGQVLAYRDLLMKLGPEAVSAPSTEGEDHARTGTV